MASHGAFYPLSLGFLGLFTIKYWLSFSLFLRIQLYSLKVVQCIYPLSKVKGEVLPFEGKV